MDLYMHSFTVHAFMKDMVSEVDIFTAFVQGGGRRCKVTTLFHWIVPLILVEEDLYLEEAIQASCKTLFF